MALIGRAWELRQVEEFLVDARAGRGSTVLVEGRKDGAARRSA
jgi:hypothetical protein